MRFYSLPRLIVFVVVFGLFCSGCQRAVVSGFSHSPDAKYQAAVVASGQLGESYYGSPEKMVKVEVASDSDFNHVLWSNQYPIHSKDLRWIISWTSNDALVVIFYDGGVVENSTSSKQPKTSNCVGQLVWDGKIATFR
jgi:hypothetical protein